MLFKKSKTAIIAGCGRLGANVAGILCSKGYDVIVVDKDSLSFHKLPENFSGYEIVGDATDTDILEKLGIKEADYLVAATDCDNTNSLICQIASRLYHLPNVFMRLSDPEKESIIDGFNIKVIYPFKLSVSEFERLSHLDTKHAAVH